MREFVQTELTDTVVEALKSHARSLQYLIEHPGVNLSRNVTEIVSELTKVNILLRRIKAEKLNVSLYERE